MNEAPWIAAIASSNGYSRVSTLSFAAVKFFPCFGISLPLDLEAIDHGTLWWEGAKNATQRRGDFTVRRAVRWLESRQREDGGWGEDGATYWDERHDEVKESTASQTAWALLALMAAGEVNSDAVRRGIDYLLDAPRDGARWTEDLFTAVGFPRVFYLRYHGYAAYFPLWALARYRNLTRGNQHRPTLGM